MATGDARWRSRHDKQEVTKSSGFVSAQISSHSAGIRARHDVEAEQKKVSEVSQSQCQQLALRCSNETLVSRNDGTFSFRFSPVHSARQSTARSLDRLSFLHFIFN